MDFKLLAGASGGTSLAESGAELAMGGDKGTVVGFLYRAPGGVYCGAAVHHLPAAAVPRRTVQVASLLSP
jgi:hypothetical protein